ncbi:MAG: dTDP-4-dehydrorhamnose 3,5-epimerase [Candidatus Anaerobiospirillum merdipullorum]|uniref:dTDP-4-dehydrorhamnose 3,5-epimerase n=1 Tax=Candidatus Anaerobiospirillum merdipullorum TaxID=2838450 RepID=A0A9E2NSZ1_9GAMM|nr:dTDP-4-dehydrorhamnose 3,5-epimerase [Candidatus Anaerobiospirillum merdipullorum]
MEITKLYLDGLYVINQAVYPDARGYFSEISRTEALSEALGRAINFVQSNVSYSEPKVLRGLHFQQPQAQGKLVRCLQGTIFDVAVDVRPHSATFGKAQTLILSADNAQTIWIPEGFAHGFMVTAGPALVLYQCTALYAPQCAYCLNAADATLNIKWPFDPQDCIRSAQDAAAPLLKDLLPLLEEK